MAVTAKRPNTVRPFTSSCPEFSRDLDRLALFRGSKAHGRSALQFVPGEALAFNGTLKGLEQNYGEQLPIGEPLQPHLAQQPSIFFGFWLGRSSAKASAEVRKSII